MTDKQIIDDCPYFIGGNCQEYLDGVCENHKCDLKIIRELEEKLSNKRKECDELRETVKSQKEEIKNLNYTLYEERNLTTDLAKANLKISTLERSLSSVRNRFKNENQQNKEIIKAKEQECEELKKQVEIFTRQLEKANKEVIKEKEKSATQRQKNEKYEQTLAEIKEIAEKAAKCLYATKSDDYTDGYRWLGSIILQKISECEVENE